jgi:hypothetical protein
MAKAAATPANTHAEEAPFILIPVAAPEAEVLGAADDFDTEGLAVTDAGDEEVPLGPPVLPATGAEFDEGTALAPEAAPAEAVAPAPAPAAAPEAEAAPATASMPAR